VSAGSEIAVHNVVVGSFLAPLVIPAEGSGPWLSLTSRSYRNRVVPMKMGAEENKYRGEL
jgi:hypothetical protein